MKLQRIGLVVSATNDQGYNTIIGALSEPEMLEIFTPVIFGIHKQAVQAIKTVHPEQQLQLNVIQSAEQALDGRVNIIDGYATEEESLKAIVPAFLHNDIDLIVCLPTEICNTAEKAALSEVFASSLEIEANEILDWQICGSCRTLTVSELNLQEINKALRHDFLLIKPRLAVVSANEELSEEIRALREEGIFAFGPFKPETLAETVTLDAYDALVYVGCQPAPSEEEEEDGKLTYGYISGLPMAVTYLSAGQQDSVQGLKEAIYAVIDITRARISYRRATHNPLEKQWVPRGRDDFKLDLTKEIGNED